MAAEYLARLVREIDGVHAQVEALAEALDPRNFAERSADDQATFLAGVLQRARFA